MIKLFNPDSVAPPFSRYSHAAEASGHLRWLHVSGQVGITPDGTLLVGFEAQATQTWRNILAILAEAGMGPADLVKVNMFLTDAGDVPASRSTRETALGDAAPACSLVVVASLASPDWLVEIEAIAAAP